MNTNFLFKILIVFFIFVIIFPLNTSASEFRSGDKLVITKDEVVNDDIYFAGSSVIVEGTINGDLVAAGGEIRVTGTINGGIMVVGGSIIVNGTVTDDIRAAGGEVRIGGDVGDNVLTFTGKFVLEKNARIARDLTLSAGNAVIDGTVNGNINGGATDLEMSGAVKGNVTLEIDNNIKIFPGATIGENLEYKAPHQGEISGIVSGKTTYKEIPAKKGDLRSKIEGEIIGYLWLLLIGIVSLLLAPELTQKNSDMVAIKPLRNLLYGLLFLVITPIVVVLLLITIIGIPLSMILLVIYIIFLYISRIYIGFWVGQYVLKKLKKETKFKVLTMALGLLIVLIGINLPIIGGFIHFVVLLLGLGAIALTEYDIYRKLIEQKVI
jgi:cytoskeletal protein CcmA (bactofilin family)